MINTHKVDIVIIGGGIAGLWTLATARNKGYNAILFEKNQLGQGQTIASQGIIHGGSKYALAGSITRATSMISDMPNTWKKAIFGEGDIDLRTIEILCDTQHLIPSAGIDTKLLSFFGSKNMASHTEKVNKEKIPDAYKQIGINRSIFRLNEIVINVKTLLNSFLEQYHGCIYQKDINLSMLKESKDSQFPHQISIDGEIINATYIVLACGEHNAEFSPNTFPMQKRPLQMVMMKSQSLPKIYGHIIGRSTKPLLTITSHPSNNSTVWYMGGDLAEDGVDLNENQQIDASRKLLRKILPELHIDSSFSFGTHPIDRAEPQQNSLTRPDDAFIVNKNNIISGWPTKLALAPRFAEKVMAEIMTKPNINSLTLPPNIFSSPTVAKFPWESL